ncbi:MAG: diacylglycerol kinase family lipid kinase [Candidatus Eisenbacteria bacterium]|uniref:Diacylglycerol kinase family lipid kinase n=1 Tax=Eiseniibacteriota bacterium TaxID=2212470 RepID=A0A956NF70_UNCEI|nr:diacylglycerol kinase family lipid kinase [Candidatus Eisenbacteria bacterium]
MDDKALIIMNPTAGQGDPASLRETLESALEQTDGWSGEVRETTGAGDCAEWAGTAEEDGFDRIIAVGGDGTALEAAEGLLTAGRSTPLGVVPQGTANVLAGVLCLPTDPAEAVKRALIGETRDFDLGYLPELDRCFLIGLGIGVPAQTVEKADREAKNRFGFGAYLGAFIEGLIENRSAVLDITVDGESVVAPGQSAILANLGEFDILGLTLAEGISPHDGLLDFFVIDHTEPGAVLESLKRFLGSDRKKEVSGFLHRKARSIRIESQTPLSVQIDGEWIGRTPVEVQVEAAAVSLVVGEAYSA